MACVLVEKKEIDKIKNSQYINSGDEGCCYLYNHLIVKLYHDLKYYRNILFDLEQSNFIAFPQDILVDMNSKKIIGYTMQLLNGINLKNGFQDELELDKLKKAYLFLKQEIKQIPYVDMQNISLTNILYDYQNNYFNLIDTSLWQVKSDSILSNIEKINKTLIKALSITLDWNRYKYNDYKSVFELYGMYLNNESYFIEFLNEIIKVVESNSNSKVKTIKDLKI